MSDVILTVVQGDDYLEEIIVTQDYFAWKAISAISLAAPCIVTSAGHGIVEGQPFEIESARGMTEINRDENTGLFANGEDFYFAFNVATNTIELNDVNSLDFTAYSSGGVLKYQPVYDLTGYSARLMGKNAVGDTTAIVDWSTTNGKLAIIPATGRIAFNVNAAATAALSFDQIVFDLELINAGGVVTKVIKGVMLLEHEVTA